jgi:hypothetical protein
LIGGTAGQESKPPEVYAKDGDLMRIEKPSATQEVAIAA